MTAAAQLPGVYRLTYRDWLGFPDDGRLYELLARGVLQAEIVEFKTPLGLDLRKGVVLLVDRRQRFATDLLTCKAEGCVGFAPMTTELLRALAGGSELEVVWTDNDTDRQQSYAFSLVGFVRSYNTFFEQ